MHAISQLNNACWKQRLVIAAVPLMLSACAGLPDVSERARSNAIIGSDRTTLAKYVQPLLVAHPGQSGSHAMPNGQDSFAARIALANAAQRSLDVQYFIWSRDLTGQALLESLVRAADRGVRVRVLLDDLGSSHSDRVLLALDSHPNIEIRLFNPVTFRSPKLVGMVAELSRIDRRMHNKSFIADGRIAIVGGRNIADEYFAARSGTNYGDLDVVTIGPVVKEVSNAFDLYWNSRPVIAVTDVAHQRRAAQELAAIREGLTAEWSAARISAYGKSVRQSEFTQQLKAHRVSWYWGQSRVITDNPEKALTSATDESTHLAPKLRAEANATRKELFLVSPYFVPRETGVSLLAAARQRGVRVVVVTNSLASTDGKAAFSGYQPSRKALLRAGVELYELKPQVGEERLRIRWASPGSAGAGLHAKTFSFDRRTLFIGSFNFDPRSRDLNTEIGVLIDCPALASRLPEKLGPTLATEAYRVELEGNRLVWVTQQDGREVRYYNEPTTTFGRRVSTWLVGLLPIKREL
jgi:putative cardiolipin synthase